MAHFISSYNFILKVKLSGFRHAIEMQDPALSEENSPPKVHAYKYDPVGLPWKAPELLEQNCAGYDSKIDIYRYNHSWQMCLFNKII